MQPSLRREWQLRRGDEVVASLRIPLLRRGATANQGGRALAIERQGRVRSDYVVRDLSTGEQFAGLRPAGLGRVLELGDRSLEWKRLDRRGGHGFVGHDGEPVVRGKVSSGLLRTGGEIEVTNGVAEEDALVLALLTSFLLIRKAEEDASAAGSTVAATGP